MISRNLLVVSSLINTALATTLNAIIPGPQNSHAVTGTIVETRVSLFWKIVNGLPTDGLARATSWAVAFDAPHSRAGCEPVFSRIYHPLEVLNGDPPVNSFPLNSCNLYPGTPCASNGATATIENNPLADCAERTTGSGSVATHAWRNAGHIDIVAISAGGVHSDHNSWPAQQCQDTIFEVLQSLGTATGIAGFTAASIQADQPGQSPILFVCLSVEILSSNYSCASTSSGLPTDNSALDVGIQAGVRITYPENPHLSHYSTGVIIYRRTDGIEHPLSCCGILSPAKSWPIECDESIATLAFPINTQAGPVEFSSFITMSNATVAGDVDGDGILTTVDAGQLIRMLGSVVCDTAYNIRADINLDGVIDDRDVAHL
jgi:hypothetical protein